MILVVGATGSLGGRITRMLLEQGKPVRVLVRRNSPSEELAKQGRANTVQSLVDAGAEPIYGDLKDRASLDAACQGIDTVVTTATATQRWGEDNIQTVDLEGNQNLIAAAAAAGVKRFIFTSIPGAVPGHPLPLFHYKGLGEEAIEKSGMEWTIVQPAVFMEIWVGMVVGMPLRAGQPVSLVGQGNHKQNFISEADVAKFAVGAVDNPRAANRRLIVGGPASYTWTEVVDCASDVLGTKLPVQYLPLGSHVPLLPDEASPLMNGMETYETFLEMGDLANEYGIQLTTLDQYLRRTFGQR